MKNYKEFLNLLHESLEKKSCLIFSFSGYDHPVSFFVDIVEDFKEKPDGSLEINCAVVDMDTNIQSIEIRTTTAGEEYKVHTEAGIMSVSRLGG